MPCFSWNCWPYLIASPGYSTGLQTSNHQRSLSLHPFLAYSAFPWSRAVVIHLLLWGQDYFWVTLLFPLLISFSMLPLGKKERIN